MRFRLSVNITGAPSLKAAEFSSYNPKLITGVSLQVIAPTGQYNPGLLINLSSNRWVLRPQIGVSRNYIHWMFEAYFSTWIFFPNYNFFRGKVVKQDPIYSIKVHGIRKFNYKSWLTLDFGYAVGGQAYLTDEAAGFKISGMRLGATYAIPVAQKHTLRLNALTAFRFQQGSDLWSIALYYQCRWIRIKKKPSEYIGLDYVQFPLLSFTLTTQTISVDLNPL